MEKRLNSAVIVLFSLAAAHIIDMMPQSYPVALYYLSFMSLHLIIMLMCCKSNHIPTLIYGLLNFVHILLYFPLLISDNDFINFLIWDAKFLNLSKIMYTYETLLLISGGISAGILLYHWFTDACGWNSFGHKFSARTKT